MLSRFTKKVNGKKAKAKEADRMIHLGEVFMSEIP